MTRQDINVTVGKKELNLAIEKTIVNYSGTSNFLSLTDTPNNYTDSAGKLLRVKSTEDGIEFTDSPNVVDWNEIGGDQSDISLSGFTNDSGFISNLTTFTTDNLIEGTTNLYDKEVVLNAGTGIGISGSYPEFTISNTQVSAVWGNITGTLTDQVDLKEALDLKYNSSSFNADWDTRLATKTTDNVLEGSTNLYDKTVALTAGDGIQVTGTYPDFTITNISEGNTDHSALDNLDYENSGHTGFQPAGNYLTSESDPVFTSSQAYNITQTDITNLSNLSGTNSGDQDSSDFDIKDLTDSNNLRTTWSGKQDALTAGTNVDITNNIISATDTKYSSGDFNLSSLGDVDDTDKAEGKILQVDSLGKHVYVTNAGGSDGKVKYDSNDTTAGYLSEKIIAGTGISLSEGTDSDENKLVITNTSEGNVYTAGNGIDITENVISNTGVLTESDPVFNSWDKSTGISITESQISDFGNYLTSETDPLSVHLDQTIPQTFTAGDVSGSGLLKVTLGVLGLDTTTYVTGTPWTSEGYITDANSDGKIYGRKDGGWTEVTSGGATNLVDLGDVDDTAKATGKILQVNSDGDHEYVDLPDPDVSGLVPYTGATSDVDLENYDLTATDITSEGNLKILNEKFIQGRNYTDSAEVDILKVNADDEVEAGADFNFGLLEFSTIIEPISPMPDSSIMYQEATGTTPNRIISLVIKNQSGEKVILSTLRV